MAGRAKAKRRGAHGFDEFEGDVEVCILGACALDAEQLDEGSVAYRLLAATLDRA